MEHNDNILKIIYTGDIDDKFEEGIKQLAYDNGWKWCGEGVNITTGERDLVFLKYID